MKTAQEFYDFYKNIPESNWCEGTLHRGDRTKCCALGHLGYGFGFEVDTMIFKYCHINLWNTLDQIFGCSVVDINDNTKSRYTHLGSSPKQRILNALTKIMNGESIGIV